MAEFSDRTFSGDGVETDGNHFSNCRFENLSLLYSGGPHPQFDNCAFDNTGWFFTDGALRTIQFLQKINAAPGGQEFIASLFQPDTLLAD